MRRRRTEDELDWGAGSSRAWGRRSRPTLIRVLICEDQPPLRSLLSAILPDDHFQVLGAGCADECLAEARRAKPDILIMDLSMPGPSGLDVLRELRGHPPLGEASVIVVAAGAEQVNREAALDARSDVERVVERHERYNVVEKHGPPDAA